MILSLLFSFGDDNAISNEDGSELLKTDVLESITFEMRKQFPRISEILISERDQYLAYKIKGAPGRKIIAILGGTHVSGMKEKIFKFVFWAPFKYSNFTKLKGFLKNRFLRVLLIVIMANIGSSIGFFVAGLDIIKTLFQF